MSSTKTELLPYLEQYGSHCMAYTSLEPDMEYFVLEGVGYIAYTSVKHWFWAWKERKVVLADPVCDHKNYHNIISHFVKKYPRVIFMEASRELAEVLDGMGYEVNQFGIETDLSLADFDLKGKQRAKLRQWRNKCQREGVSVKEEAIEDCKNLEEIRALSAQWLAKKGGKEFSFLVRPLRFKNDKDARYFWAYKQEKLIGVAVFDPIYNDGNVVGYYHNIDRITDDAPHGTSVAIILSAIEVFSQEDKQFVSLGMSPLLLQRGMVNEDFNYRRSTRKAFWYAFDKLNFIYPFQGNASHKKKFNGVQKPVYISSTTSMNMWEVFVMLKANDQI